MVLVPYCLRALSLSALAGPLVNSSPLNHPNSALCTKNDSWIFMFSGAYVGQLVFTGG